jgi:DnaJ-class molecular chaperone
VRLHHPDSHAGDPAAAEKFKELLAARERAPRGGPELPAAELVLHLTVAELRSGGFRRVAFPERDVAEPTYFVACGRTLEFELPADLAPGERLRWEGWGRTDGVRGGDLVLIVERAPEAGVWGRGPDVVVPLGLSLLDWLLGGEIAAATPVGPLVVQIGVRTPLGEPIRVEGAGLRRREGGRGDITLVPTLLEPDWTPELRAALVEDRSRVLRRQVEGG